MIHKYKKMGFTIIELLITIAIIGILSTLIIVSFKNSRAKARDADRISDIRSMQEAVELYMEDNQRRPPNPGVNSWAALGALITPYLQAGFLPTDPLFDEGYNYVYCRSGYNYLLAAVLEIDQEIANDLDDAHGYTLATDCIFSGGSKFLDCSDIDGAGNLGDKVGTVFCAGFAKGT